eukprot:5946387-Prorocentrum_lima.AAC.1
MSTDDKYRSFWKDDQGRPDKLRANSDAWHDVAILGLEGRDLVPSQDMLAPFENQEPPAPGSRPGSSAD